MKIAIGSDHGGFELKEHLKKHFDAKHIAYHDFGTFDTKSVDYPDYGKKVGHAVVEEPYDFGIVICGTGIGISIAANKVKGVRAALIYDLHTAKLAKEHNNANVIALGGRTLDYELASDMVDTFMQAKFEERHQSRIDKLEKGI